MPEKQTRRTFSKEFKLDVINQSEQCDKITELAADLGLRPALIYRWRAEFKGDPKRSFPGNGVEKQTPDEKKIARLQRELADTRIQRDIFKKGHGHLRQPHQVIYQFMDDHKDEFSIVKMSEVLGVSRSGYYRWRGRGPSTRALENKALTAKITQIWEDSSQMGGNHRFRPRAAGGG